MSGGSLGLGPGGLRRAQTTEEAEAEAETGMASSGMAFSDESDGSDGSERHDRLPTDGSADGEGGAAVRVAFPPFLLALRPTPSALDEAELGLILDLAESLIGSFFAKEGRFGEGVQYNYLSLFGIDSQTWVEEGRSYCAPGADEEGDRQRCEEPCEYGYGSLSSCGNGRACLPNVASCPVAAAVTGGRRADDGNGNGNGNGNGASNRGRPQLRRSLQDDGEGADAEGSAPKGSVLLSFSGGVVNFSIEASAAREPTEALLGKMAGRVVEGRLADMLSRMGVRGESDAFPNVELSNLANIMDVSVDLLPVTETQPETDTETAEALAGTAVPASSTSTSEIQMTAGPTLLPTLSPTLLRTHIPARYGRQHECRHHADVRRAAHLLAASRERRGHVRYHWKSEKYR